MIKKLAAVAAGVAAVVGIAAPAEAGAVCPPGCVVAGAISGTGIVPDPNQLDLVLDWAAVDARGDLPAVTNGKINVIVNMQVQNVTPAGPQQARGDGIALLDYDGDGSYESGYAITAIRTGYNLTGTLVVAGAKAQNQYNPTYAFNLDAHYLAGGGSWRVTGVAAEVVVTT